ncbi:MAG: polysaccharide lyase [Pseudomonadota bacterium]
MKRVRTTVAVKLTLVALASLIGPGAVASGETPASIVFQSDFENGSIDTKLWNISGNAPTVTSEVARAGKYAMKTVLNRKTSPKSFRTEVSTGGKEKVKPGQEYWYGFSIYLPKSYVADNIWEIVAQWHSSPDNEEEFNNAPNPPLSLHTGNGVWTISTIWDAKPITDKKLGYDGKRSYKLGSYATGKWTDWVFRVKWSHKSDGLLQVWKDGQLVIDHKGPVGFNDRNGPYLKLGIYKGWKDRTNPAGVVSERVLYHDEVRIAGPGGRYEDVAPGGKKPTTTLPRPAAPTGIRFED